VEVNSIRKLKLNQSKADFVRLSTAASVDEESSYDYANYIQPNDNENQQSTYINFICFYI
jgi:hypothetical protein